MTDRAAGEISDDRIDTVRASRDGHTYHETWAARSALELLPPSTTLRAIAIEGFEKEDAGDLSDEAAEIADTVRYHGGRDIARAELVEVIQFKYSISKAATGVRAADLKKTLGKFAQTEEQLREKHGADHVAKVVRYIFATNRPVNEGLIAALRAAATGETLSGDSATQLQQIKDAIGSKIDLQSFASRFSVSGRGGMLREVEAELRRTLASWSAPSDALSEKRLLKLKSLVREKAGSAGQQDNLIDRVAVLAELEIDCEDELYPAPASFPPVTEVITRPVVEDIVQSVKSDCIPLVVHAAGGMGKTVLMQAVADRLAERDQVVLFDGFGAGRWRDPADGRHRSRRTLVHIANLLAGAGLCDILLASDDDQATLRALRQRLASAVASVRALSETAGIVLVLDAIDHAGMAAEDMGGDSFGHLLLSSLAVQPIDGVHAVASCRTHRIKQAIGNAAHRKFEVPPFTEQESRQLILQRDPSATEVEISALERRAGGNPRYLDTLLVTGRPYDWSVATTDARETSALLDELLEKRFKQAREMAKEKGASDDDLNVLFSALATLPPPVPLEELAAAQGMSRAEVESFVADLAPLIERTPHGLMFRDEPTETLIREDAKEDIGSRQAVIGRLKQRQDQSHYAARALPAVLTALHDRQALFELAFEERVPPGASKISQRDIRLARILSSLAVSAEAGATDEVFQLLLEASVVAAGHQRSDRFLYEHPELAAIAGDSEALRRLFETKAGWPGGRNSALALAHAFLGDMAESRRHANRAIDWFNWSVAPGRKREPDNGPISRKWDDIGFAYSLMLDGKESRVAGWLTKRSESDAYEKYADLFDLLERSASASSDFTTIEKFRTKLKYCRLKSRAFYAAALTHSDGKPESEAVLLQKLASCPAPSDPSTAPLRALLLGAAMAIGSGDKAVGQAIYDGISVARPSIYDYSSYWPVERATDRLVLAAGIKAALTGRKVTLLDMAPKEFIEAVPPSITKRGPAAFARALDARLRENATNSQRRRKTKYSHQMREEHSRALKHRIEPLFPFADHIAAILSARTLDARTETTKAAFDYLFSRDGRESGFPYRDGRGYLARSGGLSFIAVCERLDTIEAELAKRIVSWLKTAPGFFIPDLIAIIGRFSRHPELHDACLDLAVHVETLIQKDTQTDSRISSYGSLARAVWRVSADEAAAYFRRALDLADAIGSEDFDRTNSLLELLSTYRGAPLAPQASFTFARIAELNLHDARKFPWVDFARALVPISGLAAVGTITRFDDRDVAGLDLSWGPMITVLTEAGAISARIAVAVFGVAEPRESYSWYYHHFLQAALSRLDPDEKEWAFEVILVELDREDHLVPWTTSIDRLRTLAREHLPKSSAALARIEALSLRRPLEELAERVEADFEQKVFGVDFMDSDAIDAAIELEEPDAAGNRWPMKILLDLAQQPLTPAAKHGFVQAVVDANEPSLADKVRTLEDRLVDWSERSAALRDALPQLARTLATRHALELVSSAWEADASWRILLSNFQGNRSELVFAAIQALTSNGKAVAGDGWLSLAVKLAPLVGSNAFKAGLERFLKHSSNGIPDEVGDGPWRRSLEISQSPTAVIIEFLWSRLARPDAPARWRAAHALRRLAAIGEWEVIDGLIARYNGAASEPYHDLKLPFYQLHAQLWLLISIARIARDHPEMIARHREFLEGIAFSAAYPHLLMRRFAAMALRELLRVIPASEAIALERDIDAVNTSPFPPGTVKLGRSNIYASRPEGEPEPSDKFHLEYDFHKYQASDLCDLFGVSGWAVEDAITTWVRKWDATVHGMYTCPRLGEGSYHDGSWSNGPPQVDRYGGYLGWHALMLVAGQMLATLPTSKHSWKDDPLASFIAYHSLSRADGYWLADATDLFPLDVPKELPMPEGERTGLKLDDIHALSSLLTLANTGDPVVAGNWQVDESNVSVRTLIANAEDARATMLAVMLEGPFHRWLPHDRDVEREFGGDIHSVRNWIDTDTNDERHLDRHDPYGCGRALLRAKPDDWLISKYGLAASDPFGREWRHADSVVFRAEAWGTEGGKGDHHWEISGDRMAVSREFLSEVLTRENAVLVGLIKARRYYKDKPDRSAGGGSFAHRTAAFTIDSQGKLIFLRSIPTWAKHKIAKLNEERHATFESRFVALRHPDA